MNYVKTIMIFLITLVAACAFTRNTGSSFTNSDGNRVIYASKIIHFPDGGTEYDFNIDGQLDTTRIPPEGFDFSTATDTQLEFYHIPHDKNRVAGLQRNDPRLRKIKLNGGHSAVMVINTHLGHSSLAVATPNSSAHTASK